MPYNPTNQPTNQPTEEQKWQSVEFYGTLYIHTHTFTHTHSHAINGPGRKINKLYGKSGIIHYLEVRKNRKYLYTYIDSSPCADKQTHRINPCKKKDEKERKSEREKTTPEESKNCHRQLTHLCELIILRERSFN